MNKNHAEVRYRKFKIKNPQCSLRVLLCGERGIRTPGGVTLNSFQDCRIRPLCHFSLSASHQGVSLNAVANILRFLKPHKLFWLKFQYLKYC